MPLPQCLKQDFPRVALLVLTACAAGTALDSIRPSPLPWSHRTKAERLAAEVGGDLTKGAFARISLTELKKHMAAGDLLLVDARPPLFFRAGHLPGALNLPREGFQAAYDIHRAALEAARGKRVVVYCQGKACEDSELVAAALRALGFADLSVFVGGWNEWRAAGLQTDTGI